MTCTLDVHHAVMSAALRHAMAKRQRLGTGSATYGALGPPRAAGGGDRAGAELLRHTQGGGSQETIRRDGTLGGTRHHWVLSPGDMRCLVPTTMTIYRHLAICRHRLPGREDPVVP